MNIELPYKWEPRNYQLPAWQYFAQDKEGLRGVMLWHRRAGKDLFAINLMQSKMVQRVGLYWHMLPSYKQGRKIVWDGFTRDGRKFLDHFHPALTKHPNNTEMKLHLKNGSIYQVVGTDDINSLVGTNPVGVVLSEYSLHDPSAWDYLRPILAENGGWACFIYTARGHNHGYDLYKMASTNPTWFCERLVAGDEGTKDDKGCPVISDAVIEEERKAGMSEAMVKQEFYNDFDAPNVGAYYVDQMEWLRENGRIIDVPYEANLPVHTAWDLGMRDATVIWFYQSYRGETRLIDYEELHGEDLHGCVLKLQSKEYVYGNHYAPFDIKVKEYQTGQSRLEAARALGIRFRICPKHRIQDGIDAVRRFLRGCWFDQTRCERGIEVLRRYTKEYDEKNRVYRATPKHDQYSHGADAFRVLAYSHRAPRENAPGYRKQRSTIDVDEYQYV